MPAISWEGPVQAAADVATQGSSPVVRQAVPTLAREHRMLLSSIQGIAYGYYEKLGRHPSHGDCTVRITVRRRFFGESTRFLCGLRLTRAHSGPHAAMAWPLPLPGKLSPQPKLRCTTAQPLGNELVDCLPIEQFVLHNKLTPQQLAALRDEMRITTAAALL